MGKKMFCFQCQEACRNTGCTLTGMCGKNAETSAVMDKLLRQLKLIALTKKTDRELGRFVIQSLFMTVTNANFDSARLQNQLSKAETMTGTAAVDVPSGVLACADEDIRSLRELLLYGLKGISAYAEHAAVLGFEDEEIYSFIFKALAATASNHTASELTAMVLEAGNIAVKTKEKPKG